MGKLDENKEDVKRLDPPAEERRKYLKTVGALVAGLAIGGAAGWLSKPAERVEVPGVTVTERVTETVTVPITPTPTPTPWKGVLRVVAPDWRPHRLFAEYFNPEYEAKTGVKVEYDFVPFLHLYEKEVAELAAGGSTYDIIITDICWFGEYAEAGWIEPLKKYLDDPKLTPPDFDIRDFHPPVLIGLGCWNREIYGMLPYEKAVDTSLEKGYLFGIPADFNVGWINYRSDLLEDPREKEAFEKQYGYELVPPDTFEQYRDIAEFFYRPPDLYGTTILGVRGDYTTQAFLTMLYTWGGDFFDPNWEPIFNSPEGVDAWDFYCSLAKFAPPGIAEHGYAENISQMCEGIVALQFQDINCIAEIARDPETSKVWRFVDAYTMPAGPRGHRCSHSGGFGLAINAFSKHKEEAWKYLAWLRNKPNEFKLAMLQPTVCRKSVSEDPIFAKRYRYADVLIEGIGLGKPEYRPRIAQYPEITEILAPELQAALLGEKTSQEALDVAAVSIRKGMEEAGYYK